MSKAPDCAILLACRICLSCDSKLYNIWDWGLAQVFVDITGTTISQWDGLPQHVCVLCRALLLKSQDLRSRCHSAEELMRQAVAQHHFITTDNIRTINRKYHGLVHNLNYDCSKAVIKVYVHQDEQTDTPSYSDREQNQLYNLNNEKEYVIVKTDPQNYGETLDFKTDNEEMDFEADVNSALEVVLADNDEIERPEQNLEEDNKNRLVKNLKRKNVTKRKFTRPLKTCRIGMHLRTFYKEEHYREFEKKYNFKITVLTDEEMLQDMEKRKETENYKHAVEKCELCYKGFLSTETYDNHMWAHDPSRGRFECKLCHKYFEECSKQRRHFQMDHQLKFECAICGENIRSRSCAVLHAAFHAGTTFQCEYCEMNFLKKNSLNTHNRIAHPDKHAERATCAECGETFISENGLRNHQARSHRAQGVTNLRCRWCKVQFESYEAIMKHRDDQPNSKCDPKLSFCPTCGATCANGAALLEHRKTEHGLEMFTCDECSNSFTSKLSLATHMDRVHLKIKATKRPTPGYKYKRKSGRKPSGGSVARAQTTPNYRKVLVCELCGKVLQCAALLRQHLRIHAGEKPYKCDLCPKAYITRSGLMFHKVTHTGERKYECPECPAKFMHLNSVEVHRKIHSGERSYQCSICDKTFTQSGSLSNHVKYVHMKAVAPPRKRHKKNDN